MVAAIPWSKATIVLIHRTRHSYLLSDDKQEVPDNLILNIVSQQRLLVDSSEICSVNCSGYPIFKI